MLQVIYLPQESIKAKDYKIFDNLTELLSFMDGKQIDLLSIPVNIDAMYIIEKIVKGETEVNTLHIQSTEDVIARTSLFLVIAKIYIEKNYKKNIVLKHDEIDSIIKNIYERSKTHS